MFKSFVPSSPCPSLAPPLTPRARPISDCYIVYGEAKIEDSNTQGNFGNPQQAEMMERQAAEARQSSAIKATATEGEDDGAFPFLGGHGSGTKS